MEKVSVGISPRLNELLEERGWSMYKLAQETGIRKATIIRLCHGEMQRYPTDVLEAIAEALEINDMNDLLCIERIEA